MKTLVAKVYKELTSLTDTIPSGFKALFVKSTGLWIKNSSGIEVRIATMDDSLPANGGNATYAYSAGSADYATEAVMATNATNAAYAETLEDCNLRQVSEREILHLGRVIYEVGYSLSADVAVVNQFSDYYYNHGQYLKCNVDIYLNDTLDSSCILEDIGSIANFYTSNFNNSDRVKFEVYFIITDAPFSMVRGRNTSYEFIKGESEYNQNNSYCGYDWLGSIDLGDLTTALCTHFDLNSSSDVKNLLWSGRDMSSLYNHLSSSQTHNRFVQGLFVISANRRCMMDVNGNIFHIIDIPNLTEQVSIFRYTKQRNIEMNSGGAYSIQDIHKQQKPDFSYTRVYLVEYYDRVNDITYYAFYLKPLGMDKITLNYVANRMDSSSLYAYITSSFKEPYIRNITNDYKDEYDEIKNISWTINTGAIKRLFMDNNGNYKSRTSQNTVQFFYINTNKTINKLSPKKVVVQYRNPGDKATILVKS